jgi:hypothetical protein
MTSSSKNGDFGELRAGFEQIIDDLVERRPETVLNLGSGIHFVLEKTIRSVLPKTKIVSIDISEKVESDLSNHHYLQCDLSSRMPELTEKFDVIIATEVLEHLANDAFFWETLKVHSHERTRIVISIPNLTSIVCRLELLLGLQPHVIESSTTWHRAGMGLGGRLNYGDPSLEKGSLGHIRGISYRSIIELFHHHDLKITSEFGYMNSIPVWPRRYFQKFSGTIMFFLIPKQNALHLKCTG